MQLSGFVPHERGLKLYASEQLRRFILCGLVPHERGLKPNRSRHGAFRQLSGFVPHERGLKLLADILLLKHGYAASFRTNAG